VQQEKDSLKKMEENKAKGDSYNETKKKNIKPPEFKSYKKMVPLANFDVILAKSK
jgi:hypothetical protein